MQQNHVARRNNILRVLVLIAAFAVVLSIILLSLNAILPGFADVLQHGDQQELVSYIRGFGSVGGVLLAMLLQIVLIISIFFPGGPIQVAIGVVALHAPGWHFVFDMAGEIQRLDDPVGPARRQMAAPVDRVGCRSAQRQAVSVGGLCLRAHGRS